MTLVESIRDADLIAARTPNGRIVKPDFHAIEKAIQRHGYVLLTGPYAWYTAETLAREGWDYIRCDEWVKVRPKKSWGTIPQSEFEDAMATAKLLLLLKCHHDPRGKFSGYEEEASRTLAYGDLVGVLKCSKANCPQIVEVRIPWR